MLIQKSILLFICACFFQACNGQENSTEIVETKEKGDKVANYINAYKESKHSSTSKGSVSKGELLHGKLMPFSGKNFHYFDTTSYISGRAFVHNKVRTTLLSAYEKMETTANSRHFCVMECSNEHGGKLYPHRTHQNGLSVDFMVPLIKNGQPFLEMDNLGAQHYLMEFDNSGKYNDDKTIQIDFNLLALHLLTLEEEAQKAGLTIDKVILKTELKDELYATKNGNILAKSGIYITKSLTPLINSLHDDHYHVDFKLK